MRTLTSNEHKQVTGGTNIDILIPVSPNQEFNFSTGFAAGVDFVGGTLGFIIGIPAALIILPCRAIYSAVTTVTNNI